jgi:hypothetical protein
MQGPAHHYPTGPPICRTSGHPPLSDKVAQLTLPGPHRYHCAISRGGIPEEQLPSSIIQGGLFMPTSRRTFLKATLASSVVAGVPLRGAFAQEELKLHSFVPPTHVIWTDVITPWAQEVAKLSGGKLTVRLFPAMQLGGKPPELYRQAATPPTISR